MCKWGTDTKIYVIRKNASKPTHDGWHEVWVDSCIADYVQEMNNLGIITLDCCCGHGKGQPMVSVWPESAHLMEENGYDYIISPRNYATEDGREYFETYLDHDIPEWGIDNT